MSNQQLHFTMISNNVALEPITTETAVSKISTDSTVRTEVSDDSSSFDGDRRVSFGAIRVREYERIVGDHPDTRIGVPLTIGWGYLEHEVVHIDKYESERSSKGNLRMSSITRKNILHNVFGIPEEELRAAEKEVQKIKKSRDRSKKQSTVAAKSESAWNGFRRRAKKVLNAESFIKSISTMTSYGLVTTQMSHQ
jgi:hypothetical protein